MNNIFRKTSIERISSPDKLDSYLKISRISMWVLPAALLVILAGAVIWCFYGSIATTVSYYGIINGRNAFCFVHPENSYDLEAGMPVKVLLPGSDGNRLEGAIREISEKPAAVSLELVKYDALWIKDKIGGEWVRTVAIELNMAGSPAAVQNHLCRVDIIINEVRPIDMLFGY